LMIIPGRSWVAGIDIAWKTLLRTLAVVKPAEGGAGHKFRRHEG